MVAKRDEGCPHGGRNRRECDACEVERLWDALELIGSCLCGAPHVCSQGTKRCVTCIARDALKA